MELIDHEILKLKNLLGQSGENLKRTASSITLKEKNKIIWRLIYINLLDYEVDFGWFDVIELISSNVCKDKQCGYLAASTIFREKIDLLRLLINTIKQDLKECSEYLLNFESISFDSVKDAFIVSELSGHTSNKYFSKKDKEFRKQRIARGSFALSFIGNSPTLDFAENLFTDIKKIAELPTESQSFDTHVIRSKAICCLLKLFQCCPDRLRVSEWGEKLLMYFQYERNTDCLISLCNLIRSCLKQKSIEIEDLNQLDIESTFKNSENILSKFEDKNSIKESFSEYELIKEWEFLVPYIIFMLYRIRKQESKEWEFHNISHFWLQVRLIEILQHFPLSKHEQIVYNRIYQVIEDIFFQATQTIKVIQQIILTTETNFYDIIETQCIIGIAIEMSKYIIKIVDLNFPQGIIHLMGKFLLGLLYTENKNYISISISLLFESKTIGIIEDLIRRNLVILLRFTCTIDEDTTMNLLNIFSYIYDKYNWKFITKEIINSISYKYMLSPIWKTDRWKYELKRKSNNYFFPESAKTLLEEVILSVCYTIKKFSNNNEVSFKIINIIFQLLEKFQQSEFENRIEELTDSTLFQMMDILCENKYSRKHEDKDENKDGDRDEDKDLSSELKVSLNTNIQRFVTFKAFKLLSKWSRMTEKFTPLFGMRWLCFILGEYGQLISNKISVLEQIETLLNVYDLLPSNSHDEYISLVKSMILLSFTRFYCNSDQNTQNQIFEMLKLGISNRGNSLDSPEFINAIVTNTKYSNTPIKNISPINEMQDNNLTLLIKDKLIRNSIYLERDDKFITPSLMKKHQQGTCNKNLWLSLCILNKGNLYQSNYLTVHFSHGIYKHGVGESLICLKFKNLDRKNNLVKLEKMSLLMKEKKQSNCSNNFSEGCDSLTQNLEVGIFDETINTIVETNETFEQKIAVKCKGTYLNPPMISLLLRVFPNSNEDSTSKDQNQLEDCDFYDKNRSKLVSITFRLPIILTNFMTPTKKMDKNQFEHFWERFSQVSIKGKLSIPLFEITTYLQLLNFNVNNYSDEVSNSDNIEKNIYCGTSTLYLSNGKRVPCMLMISLYSNKRDLSADEDAEKDEKEVLENLSVELKIRSSSIAVARVIRQILASYFISN